MWLAPFRCVQQYKGKDRPLYISTEVNSSGWIMQLERIECIMANLGLYIYCSIAHQSKFKLLMIPS